MSQIQLHAFITGKVQGVWFRKYTKIKADSLSLKGWVRNLSDGRVEVLAQGDTSICKELESWLWEGSEEAVVSAVDLAYGDIESTFATFEILETK